MNLCAAICAEKRLAYYELAAGDDVTRFSVWQFGETGLFVFEIAQERLLVFVLIYRRFYVVSVLNVSIVKVKLVSYFCSKFGIV